MLSFLSLSRSKRPNLRWVIWSTEGCRMNDTMVFFLIFETSYISFLWYPIGSYSLNPLLQLPYGLGRGEGREPCVLWNTTLPSRNASWHTAHLTRKPAAPTCRRKHRPTGDRMPACRCPARHKESLERDETATQLGIAPGAVVTPYRTALQCLRSLRQSGGPYLKPLWPYLLWFLSSAKPRCASKQKELSGRKDTREWK